MNSFFADSAVRLPLLILIGLLILGIYLQGELRSARTAATEAADQWGACRDYSRKIQELNAKPELVASEFHSSAQIAQSIKSAMTVAEIPEEYLIRIEPRSARRIEKTPYLEQPSHLELRDVTLQQLIRFLHHLSVHYRLDSNDLRLHAPRVGESQDGQEYWSTELVLTNVIFSP